MIWWIALAILMYMFCAVLLAAEVFIPSEGLLTVCAILCAIVGGYIFFSYGARTGAIGIAVGLVQIPAVLIVAYKIFPKTGFGKGTYLEPSRRDADDSSPGSGQYQQLVGQTGISLTHLRPVGKCKIGDKKVECSAERGYLPKDTKVKAIRVIGAQVVVRPVEEN